MMYLPRRSGGHGYAWGRYRPWTEVSPCCAWPPELCAASSRIPTEAKTPAPLQLPSSLELVGAPWVGGVPGASVGEPGQQGQQQQSALFAPDIEEEANSHFQRIYTNKLQIEGVIQMLKGFKTSSNQVRAPRCLFVCLMRTKAIGGLKDTDAFACCCTQREQEVFACMIHNLFDEYRFFQGIQSGSCLLLGGCLDH